MGGAGRVGSTALPAIGPNPAATTLAPSDAKFLRDLVLERSAIVLDPSKDYLLTTRLEPVVKEEKLGSLAALVDALRKAPRGHVEGKVIDAMTTNETSFFRDMHPFQVFSDTLVPEILQSSHSLTVWCAACSSGQEPYSILLNLLERNPEAVRPGRVKMIATDLSPTMVARTKDGKYSQLEVNRGLPAKMLMKYFTQQGQDWLVRNDIRAMVDAKVLNLLEPWMGMPKCDVVFLRNVLIYFSPDIKRRILERIRKEVLKPGGYLFLGTSETTLNIDTAFVRRDIGRTFVYQSPSDSAKG
jgi:chemotaxis protein methyltransferase CheR